MVKNNFQTGEKMAKEYEYLDDYTIGEKMMSPADC